MSNLKWQNVHVVLTTFQNEEPDKKLKSMARQSVCTVQTAWRVKGAVRTASHRWARGWLPSTWLPRAPLDQIFHASIFHSFTTVWQGKCTRCAQIYTKIIQLPIQSQLFLIINHLAALNSPCMPLNTNLWLREDTFLQSTRISERMNVTWNELILWIH